MNYILFDDFAGEELLPFTFLRPVADIQIGIRTIRQKWESILQSLTSSMTEDYLSKKFPLNIEDDNILINGSVLPDNELNAAIHALKNDQVLMSNGLLIGLRLDFEKTKNINVGNLDDFESIEYAGNVLRISQLWDIFSMNSIAIGDDFERITKGRKSAELSATNRLIGDRNNLFIEEGAIVECTTINTSFGPVYIGKNAEIMEGALIRGPFALCENAVVKMGAKIYGATSIGPYSKVGGEVNNSVIMGYSNKAHEGFLGNSVVGEWCNIGADSNNSNLKNNYTEVKIWNYPKKTFVKTGLQFCGLFFGDHSKCGINTMFNTGTVVGVSANIFGCGFPRNFIPSFSWGGAGGMTNFELGKAIEVAENVVSRRNIEFSSEDRNIFEAVYNLTQQYRDL